MPTWLPNALIAAFTAVAVGWIAVRASELDLWIPYEQMFEIVEAIERTAEQVGRETHGAVEVAETIELEVRMIGLVEQIWAANRRMCSLRGAENRAAASGELFRLHQPLARLRDRIAQLDPGFHYEHLASCAE